MGVYFKNKIARYTCLIELGRIKKKVNQSENENIWLATL